MTVPEHVHVWKRSPWVIDTNPPLRTWSCDDCGVQTHHPDTGEPCYIAHPDLPLQTKPT